MGSRQEETVARLRQLVSEGESLADSFQGIAEVSDDARAVFHRKLWRWLRNVETVLSHLSLTDHCADIRLLRKSPYYSASIPEMIGILESAIDAIESGHMQKLRHLLHADYFDSITHQAEGLLDSGHATPAAVLGRIVIERWLRDLAEREGIEEFGSAKTSALNESLRQRDVFSKPRWRQIQTHLDVGNEAAHGNEDQFNDSDVRKLLEFIVEACH